MKTKKKTREPGNFIPLTIIMVQDPHSRGYTAYFKQFPDIIAEGDNENEAERNLINAVHDVFVYQNQMDDDPIDPSLNVSKKSINFSSRTT